MSASKSGQADVRGPAISECTALGTMRKVLAQVPQLVIGQGVFLVAALDPRHTYSAECVCERRFEVE